MNNFLKAVLVIIMLFLIQNSYARDFNCLVDFKKGPCWKDRSVTLYFLNTENNKVFKTVEIPQNVMHQQIEFNCDEVNNIQFRASFDPPVWENGKDKIYRAHGVWEIPLSLPKHSDKWKIKICFSNDFLGTPLPYGDARRCACQ